MVAQTKDEIKSANFLNDYLKSCYGLTLPVKSRGTSGIIIKAGKDGKDGYTLNVDKNTVSINGNTAPGAFYGIQTFIQLLPTEKGTMLRVPAVNITDAPTVGYRGLMLDVGRHVFPLNL
ncbi:beta-N-acetylhexosaminidase [Niabella defluvii]|nr:beta-N-acetylhexosaminidase [Niabella sp. I65]